MIHLVFLFTDLRKIIIIPHLFTYLVILICSIMESVDKNAKHSRRYDAPEKLITQKARVTQGLSVIIISPIL